MQRESAVEAEILRREVARLRKYIQTFAADAHEVMLIRRENDALRKRQFWLERRVNELELAVLKPHPIKRAA